jgi:hypothetical protein
MFGSNTSGWGNSLHKKGERIVSRAKIRAELAEYGEPTFPEGIDRLNDAFEARRAAQQDLNGAVLERVGTKVFGFSRMFRPTTADDYTWFWALEFARGDGRIIVCFPWAQDWNKRDGSQADRSIAVYARGASGEEIDRLLGDLTYVLERA